MRPTKNSDIHFVAIDRISYVCNFEIRFESLYAKIKITKCTRDAFSREHFVIFVFPYKDLNNRRFQKHTLEILSIATRMSRSLWDVQFPGHVFIFKVTT